MNQSDAAVLAFYKGLVDRGITVKEYLDSTAFTTGQICVATYRFARVFVVMRKYMAAKRLLDTVRGAPHLSDKLRDCMDMLNADIHQQLDREAAEFAENVWL